MKAKLLTLIIGGLLVAFGSRWFLVEGISAGWFTIFLALLMFLVGQWLVRFEDYPNGQQWVSQLNDWLNQL